MKIKIGEFDVDVKVRRSGRESRASKESAIYFLNQICIWADEASENLDRNGHDVLAKLAKEKSDEIYRQLKDAGAYDDRH